MARIVDYKPKIEAITDYKPKAVVGKIGLTERLYEVSVAAGMPMGLLLSLTYPSAGTFISSITG